MTMPVQKAFSSLKDECIYRERQKMLQIAAELADEYIRFYNYERTHLSTKMPPRKMHREQLRSWHPEFFVCLTKSTTENCPYFRTQNAISCPQRQKQGIEGGTGNEGVLQPRRIYGLCGWCLGAVRQRERLRGLYGGVNGKTAKQGGETKFPPCCLCWK